MEHERAAQTQARTFRAAHGDGRQRDGSLSRRLRKEKNADVFGPRLMGDDGIRARIGELQAGSATAATLTMQLRREIACAIARDATAKASDRLAAILADARLAGELKGDSVSGLSEDERAEHGAAAGGA